MWILPMLTALATAGDTCREGLFVREGGALRPMRVTAEKSPFYSDDGECPVTGNCAQAAYVVAGDRVLAAHTRDRFTCVWYQGATRVFVGFVATDTLIDARTGTFAHHDNELIVTPGRAGLRVDGIAIWKGYGDNVHVGEVHGELLPLPDGRFRVVGAECEVTLQWVDGAWAAADDGGCGGVNVSFDGIYARR